MKDLRLVEFAVTLARYRHFARAAQALGLSQPALSRGIARLERELGSPLFERTTRSVQPTAAGLAFVERAKGVLEDAARLTQLHDEADGSLTGQLTIGSGPYPLEISVLPSIARLSTANPGLRVRLIEGAWRNFAELLLSGGVDVAIVHASMFSSDRRFEVELLTPHPGCLVCRSGHPLARRRRVSKGDIDRYPLVGIAMVGSTIRQVGDVLEPFMRQFAVDPNSGELVSPISTTSTSAAREIIARTDGLGLFAEPNVHDAVAAGHLEVLRTDFPMPSTGYAIVRLRGRNLAPPARRFIEVLLEVEAEVSRRPAARGRARRVPKGTSPRAPAGARRRGQRSW